MSRRRKPRCFVAMAFERSDTDELYSKIIGPLLKRNGVTPVIINRRQDNRDINVQIIEQLDRCDFCVADLTYARPSVYFEAGYAERQVEVIYTVRADHLKRSQPDEARVHFDLQMKPLVVWKNPTDVAFARKLESRLKSTVLKKIAARAAVDEAMRRQRAAFASVPVEQRLTLMRKKAISCMRTVGFRTWRLEWPSGRDRPVDRTFKDPSHLASQQTGFVGRQTTRKIMHIVSLRAVENATLRYLKDLGSSWGRIDYPRFWMWYHFEDELRRVKSIEEHHVVFALKNTPDSRVMSAMPYLKKDGRAYSFKTRYHLTRYPETRLTLERLVRFFFISSVLSKPDLAKRIAELALEVRPASMHA